MAEAKPARIACSRCGSESVGTSRQGTPFLHQGVLRDFPASRVSLFFL
jgi:hypothetical protein